MTSQNKIFFKPLYLESHKNTTWYASIFLQHGLVQGVHKRHGLVPGGHGQQVWPRGRLGRHCGPTHWLGGCHGLTHGLNRRHVGLDVLSWNDGLLFGPDRLGMLLFWLRRFVVVLGRFLVVLDRFLVRLGSFLVGLRRFDGLLCGPHQRLRRAFGRQSAQARNSIRYSFLDHATSKDFKIPRTSLARSW
jgi:hypothetical protein